MRKQTARINVTLPKELIESVDKLTGPHSRSRLIAESLREHIRQIKKDKLEKQLEEGYRVTAKEGRALAHEFETADLEGWEFSFSSPRQAAGHSAKNFDKGGNDMAENYYEGIREVIQLTPESITRCEPCNYLPNDFADTINHYLTKHGYKLLHVGTQSSLHRKGDVVHDVTALLGK